MGATCSCETGGGGDDAAGAGGGTRGQAAPAMVVSKVAGGADELLVFLTEHRLQTYHGRLGDLGCDAVGHLQLLDEADLDTIGMKKIHKLVLAKAIDSAASDSTAEATGTKTARPHFGELADTAGPGDRHASPGAADNSSAGFDRGFRTMLSYQWDAQKTVVRVREALRKKGVECWMDIDGGMRSDVYDSMSEGVSGSAAVICFMTQKYEDSQNCKLELKFAATLGKQIIPVMMQGGGWKQSGWLGILTAGALWVPMHDEAMHDEGILGLLSQIDKVQPPPTAPALASGGGEEEALATSAGADEPAADSVSSLRAELDRLRAELQSGAHDREDGGSKGSELAGLPAEVPELPGTFRFTMDMQALKTLLLQAPAEAGGGATATAEGGQTMAVTSQPKTKVGAVGMGGIGKTILSAGLCRDLDIRASFDKVCWVTLGQQPDIVRLQELLHLQVTGKPPPAGATTESLKQTLKQEMASTKLLLVIDDCWTKAHEQALNTVNADSKALVTTRIKGMLPRSEQVEVGLPSTEDSVKLLLAAAGLNHLAVPPPEATEVVELCGNLPLAIDIAGRFLRDLDLDPERWQEVPTILKYELRNSSAAESGLSVEEQLVAASLGSVPTRDRERVSQVFQVFANIEEDTFVPPQTFALLHAAVTGASEPLPELEIRRLLQILVARSLVLGSWEKPQLHDIVRDFVIGQFSEQQLRHRHRQIVNAFRAARPRSTKPAHAGLPGWASRALDERSMYVAHHIAGHVRGAIDSSSEARDLEVEMWMCDYPEDDIFKAVRTTLGRTGCEKILSVLDAAADSCSHTRYRFFDAVIHTRAITEGVGFYPRDQMFTNKSRRIEHMKVKPQQLSQAQYDLFMINLWEECLWTNANPNFAAESERLTPEKAQEMRDGLVHLLETTEAGLCRQDVLVGLMVAPLIKEGNVDEADPILLKQRRRLAAAHGDEAMSSDCITKISNHWSRLVRLDAWTWDGWGGHTMSELILRFFRGWNPATEAALSGNKHVELARSSVPCLVAYRGDIVGANRCFDKQTQYIRQHFQSGPTNSQELDFVLDASICFFPALVDMRREDDAASLMEMCGVTWAAVDSKIDALWPDSFPGQIRQRGSGEYGSHMCSAEAMGWVAKLTYVLATTWRQIDPSVVLAALPSPERLQQYIETQAVSLLQCDCYGCVGPTSLQLLAAAVCETKLERPEEALAYADLALSRDTRGTPDVRPTTLIKAQTLRGRVLASLGKPSQAEEAFEDAIAIAQKHGLLLLELLALSDLRAKILDPAGRGAEDVPRLRKLLPTMEGSVEGLESILEAGRYRDVLACSGSE